MDLSIFDVDLPVVLPVASNASSVWERNAPSALLAVALAGPGVRFVQNEADDLTLGLLAAALDAEVTVVTQDELRVQSIADLNLLQVDTAVTWPERADVLVVGDTLPRVEADVVLARAPIAAPTGHRVRVDVIGSDVVVAPPHESASPHLLVRPEQVEDVVARVKRAVDAFAHRRPNPWGLNAMGSALRWAQACQAQAQDAAEQADAEIARAHDQMRQAREELRGVRSSRSWHYTRFLRRMSGP